MKLRSFSENLFNVCPLLKTYISDVSAAINHFQSYKSVIPVRGAIILNKKMTKALMVKGWKSSATWGFPRGKINKNEPDDLCAVREVYEEIGFDISPYLVPEDYIEVTIRQKNFKLYIICGVPGNTQFCPQTRKEISKIEWHNVKSLPAFSSDSVVQDNTNYFMVAPFMHGLSKYISKKRGLPSSLSNSETKALKNLLGVGSVNERALSTPIPPSEQDKDAAAAELLDLLKSSQSRPSSNIPPHIQQQISQSKEPSASPSDRNILLDLLHGKPENPVDNTTSEVHDLESAREILSLLKTKLDRSKEEGALNTVSQQIPHPANMPTDPTAPLMMPNIPPWAFMNPPMGYQMFPPIPPNLPPGPPGAAIPQFGALPFNGVPPFPIPGYPMPPPGALPPGFPVVPPPSMLQPPSEPSTPLPQHANLSVSDQNSVFDLPRSPTQTPQPNSTLLALLNSRSKGKRAFKPKPKPKPSTTSQKASSGSVALLSLLQQPETVKEETHVAKEPQDTISSSNSLLNLLKPSASIQPAASESSNANLLNLLKGPQSQNQPPTASSPALSDNDTKTGLLNLLKSPPPAAPTSTESQSDNSSALLMGLLKGNQSSDVSSITSAPHPAMHVSAILNIPSISSEGNTSQSEPSMNVPNDSSILLGMIKSQPSSTPEPRTSTPTIYKGGITLHDLEARNFARESESPGKDLLQQLESEEKMAPSNTGNSLLSLLSNPGSSVPPAESTFPGIFDSSPRMNSLSNSRFPQSPQSTSSPAGVFGTSTSHSTTPPIGRPFPQASSQAINTSGTAGLGFQATGGSLLSLLRQSDSPSEHSSRSPSVSDPRSVSQQPFSASQDHKPTSPPAQFPMEQNQQQVTEQAHLASLFNKLQVSNQAIPDDHNTASGNILANAASIPTTTTAPGLVSTAAPPVAGQEKDLRTDLLAFLHNFSNGTLPSN